MPVAETGGGCSRLGDAGLEDDVFGGEQIIGVQVEVIGRERGSVWSRGDKCQEHVAILYIIWHRGPSKSAAYCLSAFALPQIRQLPCIFMWF